MKASLTEKTNLLTIIIRKAREKDIPVLLSFEQKIGRAGWLFDPAWQEGTIDYYNRETMLSVPGVEIVMEEENEGKLPAPAMCVRKRQNRTLSIAITRILALCMYCQLR